MINLLANKHPHSSIMVSEKRVGRNSEMWGPINPSCIIHKGVSQPLCLMLVIYYFSYCLVLFRSAPEQCREGNVKYCHSIKITNVVSSLEWKPFPSIKHAQFYLSVLVYMPDYTVCRLWSKGSCRITRVYGLRWTDLSLWDFGMLELIENCILPMFSECYMQELYLKSQNISQLAKALIFCK